MNIIEQLEQTVSTVVLAESTDEAKLSLLEQFYAILATRLSSSKVYSTLQRSNQGDVPIYEPIHSSLFEQLWQDHQARQIIIKELSAAHHINEIVTTQLLINAAPIAYQALIAYAKGQFLPAFLQEQQAVLRQYLPIWSAPIITDLPLHIAADSGALDPSIIVSTDSALTPNIDSMTASTAEILARESFESERLADSDAIHANPSEHYISENHIFENHISEDYDPEGYTSENYNPNPSTENSLQSFRKVRAHNKSVRKISWLLFALAVLAGIGLTWALVIKPRQAVVEVAAPPAPVTPINEPTPAPLIPVSMTVGVDDSGQLYTCSATVGDTNMQSALMQALSVSFGEQANTCTITVSEGVATNLSNMTTQKLPDVLTLVRAVPFARIQLQDERLVLEAPDAALLGQLLNNMRIIIPTMTIESAAPIALPQSTALNNESNMNSLDDAYDNSAPTMSSQNNGAMTGTNNYQASDDETNDRVIPDPLGSNAANRSPTINQGANNSYSAPPGPISLSELDEMASKEIRVDPVRAN